MFIDSWSKDISVAMGSLIENSANNHTLVTSINEEMITMKTSLINMQDMIQVNSNQGSKNTEHISVLNTKTLLVKKDVDKITNEVSEKVDQSRSGSKL